MSELSWVGKDCIFNQNLVGGLSDTFISEPPLKIRDGICICLFPSREIPRLLGSVPRARIPLFDLRLLDSGMLPLLRHVLFHLAVGRHLSICRCSAESFQVSKL